MLKVNKLTSVDSSSFSLYRAWRSASIASNLLFISLISFSSLRILSPSPKRTNRMSSLSEISNTDSKWRYLLPVVSASTFTLEASSDNWSKSLRGFHVSSMVNKSISSSGTRSWSLLQKQNDNTVNLLWQSCWRIVGLIKEKPAQHASLSYGYRLSFLSDLLVMTARCKCRLQPCEIMWNDEAAACFVEKIFSRVRPASIFFCDKMLRGFSA